MKRIYLDHITSTPLDPRVFEAMKPFFMERYGNPSAMHQEGLMARDALQKSREQAASFIGARRADEIYFTSGGTEANNLAIKGVAYASQRNGNHLIISTIEHPSVMEAAAFLETQGFVCTRVPVDREGRLDPEQVRAAVTDKTILIATHYANHDIGVIQPVEEIGRVAAEKGAPFFCDANAAAGWLPIDIQKIGAQLLSFTPHRFYGPKGSGVLYRNRKARLQPIIHGGGQENGRRAGTENVPAIVGAGLACELAGREQAERAAHAGVLQKRLIEGLLEQVPYLILNGPPAGPRRSPVNVSVSAEFIEGESQLLLLDHQGIAVASGGSCVSKSLKASHVLKGIGLDEALAQGSIMMTLGRENTVEEMDEVARALAGVAAKLRAMSPLWDQFQKGRIDSLVKPRPKTDGRMNPLF
ncbi:MAG: cysteine desulfurase family protein [Verrucomicrobiae bacterium]|nr:cysteine desulfurase family protein [Verrucomicrobiae bacterium]